MKRITALGLALGVAVALSGTANAQIKFGVAGPITGSNAAFGAQLKNGFEQAIDFAERIEAIMILERQHGRIDEAAFDTDVRDALGELEHAARHVADGVAVVRIGGPLHLQRQTHDSDPAVACAARIAGRG